MGPRIENLVFNSVLNFRRVTHFQMCLLERQAYSKYGASSVMNRKQYTDCSPSWKPSWAPLWRGWEAMHEEETLALH